MSLVNQFPTTLKPPQKNGRVIKMTVQLEGRILRRKSNIIDVKAQRKPNTEMHLLTKKQMVFFFFYEVFQRSLSKSVRLS